jgi:hypothetical protein
MSELRAPDPTLAAYWRIVGVTDTASGPYVAHAIGDLELVCGEREWTLSMDASDAAYIAVPCRDCFPGAPPPGHRYPETQEDKWFAVHVHRQKAIPDPHLTWQVSR